MRALAFLAVLAALALPANAEPRPFHLDGGRIATRVKIEGSYVLALIDTGAWGSSIDRQLAEELDIASARVGKTFGASGRTVPYRKTQGVDIDLGEGIAGRPRIAVMPPLGGPDGPRAVIGMDMMAHAALTIDFERMTIDFQLSRNFKPPSGEPLKMRGQWERGVSLDFGGRQVDFKIDTAASSALHVMHTEYRGRELLKQVKSSRTLVEGVDGVHEQAIASMPELVVAGVTFKDVPFTLSSGGYSQFSDSVIGIDLLRRFNTVIDFGRERIWLTPNANQHAPFRRNRIGVVNGANGAVALAAPGSPAERAGIKAGDVIRRWEDAGGRERRDAFDLPDGVSLVAVMSDGSRRPLVTTTYY